jgi:hypothetical protein
MFLPAHHAIDEALGKRELSNQAKTFVVVCWIPPALARLSQPTSNASPESKFANAWLHRLELLPEASSLYS